MITSFLRRVFSESKEDQESIDCCVKNGISMCIMGKSDKGKSDNAEQVIAAIHFCHFKDGIWINWITTCNTNFLKRNWGALGDDKKFDKN